MGRTRRLLRYLAPYRTGFWLSVAAASVASVLDGFTLALIVPLMQLLFGIGTAVTGPTAVEQAVAVMTGGLVEPGTSALVVGNVAVVILGTMLLKNTVHYAGAYLAAGIQEGAAADMRRELNTHLQRLDLAFFSTRRSGELLSRVFSDVEQAQDFLGDGLQRAIRATALVVVYVAMLFALSWRLALVVLVLAPAIALVMQPILRRVRSAAARAAVARGDLAGAFGEAIAAAKLVKTHAAEGLEASRFSRLLGAYAGARLEARRVAVLAHPVSESLGALVFVSLLAATTLGITGGPAPRPEIVVAFLGVTLRLLSPAKMLAHFPTVVAHALAGADRVFEILDRPREASDAGAEEFTDLARTITYRRVFVEYRPGERVLRDVSVTIPRGTTLAIVGPSGAGKTTMVDLLPRFVDPSAGTVCFDDVPTIRLQRRSLRRAISYVGQETVIFNDTVAANIAYGVHTADASAVEAAARAANAHHFITALPDGYQSVVGERGSLLSGGERQRIAIARALFRDAPILILDEATAALDVESERLVREALERLMVNRTVIVIAHRLATVERADQILVLDAGRIVDLGSHGELMKRDGPYRRLHQTVLVDELV